MKFSRDAIFRFPQSIEASPLISNPVGVVVLSFGPVIPGGMAKFPITKAVVFDARLRSFSRTLEVEFSDQSAIVTCLGELAADQRSILRVGVISVSCVVHPRWIEPAHEARSARGADRALAIGAGERCSFLDKSIQGRGLDVRIA